MTSLLYGALVNGPRANACSTVEPRGRLVLASAPIVAVAAARASMC